MAEFHVGKSVNGVDVASLLNTVQAVKNQPSLGRFEFSITNQWIDAGLNRSQIQDFYGAGEPQVRDEPYELENDEPFVLLGQDEAPNPVEYLLHALAGCVTTTMIYHAAARGIRIDSVETELTGDIDIRGFLGISDDVPRGYSHIDINMRVVSDASEEKLKELAQFSPVFNTITHATPVDLHVEKEAESEAA